MTRVARQTRLLVAGSMQWMKASGKEGKNMASNTTAPGTRMNSQVVEMVTIALLAAIICILAPLSIPIGPVPISLTNLVLYFFVIIVGTKDTSIAFIIYCLLGMVGLPVFSGFSGGLGKLVGPTGGYIIGFLPMIIVMGLYIEKHRKNYIMNIIVMEASTWIPYLLGTAWLSYSAKMPFAAALSAGVLPFIAEDLVKMVLAALVAPQIYASLKKAHLVA